ncbi:MAG: zf-HC2 domain-containing protein [Acidobacteria bacterium]|nr:zf-HC2 domain-containing protein [Acidobacteriota bacterium]
MKNETIRFESGCERSAETLPYIYRESTDAELARFDGHLAECEACRDEFAAISFSRFSVYEWQREEFVPLATPDFASAFAPKVADATTAGWFDAIRGWFALPHRLAFAGGFAAVLVGIFASTFYFASIDLSPENIATGNVPAVVTPAIEPVVIAEAASPTQKESSVDDVVRTEVVRASVKTVTRKVKPKPKQETVLNRSSQAVAASLPAASLPRLTEDDDEIDYGLRLADIVADIDTREED